MPVITTGWHNGSSSLRTTRRPAGIWVWPRALWRSNDSQLKGGSPNMLSYTAPRESKDVLVDRIVAELSENGVVMLPSLFTEQQLHGMQRAFDVRLKRLRWNNLDGYEKTEPYRHMVENLLVLDQGFVDAALHPTVKAILNRYLGEKYELVEARGWRSLPTRRDFHGWH